MKSPFPGMDPYLERHWLDVHASLITSARNTLNQRLPDDLIARAEERVAVEAGPEDPSGPGRRRIGPDVRVFEAVEAISGSQPGGIAVALAPYRLILLDDPIVERFIEIIDIRGGERVVTVIEFISPTNKTDGLETFVNKRNELLSGGVNFVEIDLVRTGDWRQLLRPHGCPPDAIETYRAVIRLPGALMAGFIHPFSLRAPLPVIKIPLRKDETPCELPLQPLIDDAYRDSRYDRTLNYNHACEPPLEGDDAAWADQLLRAAGRRV